MSLLFAEGVPLHLNAFVHRYSPVRSDHTQQLIETFRGASISVVMAGIISGLAQATVLGYDHAVTGLANPAVVIMIVFVASFPSSAQDSFQLR